MSRPRLLLHVCCGPCATAVYERLAGDYEVTLHWCNPNIEPVEEFTLRLAAARQLAAAWDVPLIEDAGGAEEFAALSRDRTDQPEGGERCRLCYELRLRRTLACAAAHDLPLVSTTLTISPHKPADLINQLGSELAAQYGRQWLAADFKQQGGFARSVELSRELGLYRQRYCGCRASRGGPG
jgi:hypothetical protein